ncbi:hypothetical protein [uncultured Ruminococcus sp.]|nr:hypothetical protein [uncultured Ruminococcus sp.]
MEIRLDELEMVTGAGERYPKSPASTVTPAQRAEMMKKRKRADS